MAEAWDNLPQLAPPLIEGVLRKGHKLLLAGPSKAGKSYALIELCCSIAEGRPWLGFSWPWAVAGAHSPVNRARARKKADRE